MSLNFRMKLERGKCRFNSVSSFLNQMRFLSLPPQALCFNDAIHIPALFRHRSSGIVFKAAIKETGEELAVKRIHYDKKRYGLIKKEMVFLQTMDHKNLVKYYNCVATTKTIDVFPPFPSYSYIQFFLLFSSSSSSPPPSPLPPFF